MDEKFLSVRFVVEASFSSFFAGIFIAAIVFDWMNNGLSLLSQITLWIGFVLCNVWASNAIHKHAAAVRAARETIAKAGGSNER